MNANEGEGTWIVFGYLQVKRTELEEVRIRGRERGKKIRRDEIRQSFASREKQGGSFNGGRAVAELKKSGARLAVAPCLHTEFHSVSKTDKDACGAQICFKYSTLFICGRRFNPSRLSFPFSHHF